MNSIQNNLRKIQKENIYYLKNLNISLEDLSQVEMLKAFSNFLRGTIKEELQNNLEYFEEGTTNLIKFHGMYQQDDRDRRNRTKNGLQKFYQLMVRVRISAGSLSREQYLALDEIASLFGNKTLRITTRHSIQFHGVLKRDIKQVIQKINQIYLTTTGTCGDIVRNVTGPLNLYNDARTKKILDIVNQIAEHFKSKSKAYAEIWMDDAPVQTIENEEPIYGSQYLPRKFKIAIAEVGLNSNHFFTNDMGIAVDFHGTDVAGYYFYAGGGMGKTHRDDTTFPMVSQYLGWVSKENLIPVAEAIVAVQRDYGNRKDRRHARLKYLISERGIQWFRDKVEEYSGVKFFIRETPEWKDVDYLGWHKTYDGKWSLGVFVMAGRIEGSLKLLLKTIAEKYDVSFQTTVDQNIIIQNIKNEDKKEIEKIFQIYNYRYLPEDKIYHKAIACPALPTCGLAITESERVFPLVLGILREKLKKYQLEDKAPIFRMTGCPNGCANPYVAEIALVGRSKDVYALYLGGSRNGSRIAKEITDTITIPQFEDFIDKLFFYWSKLGKDQYLGDFVNEMFNFFWIIQPISKNYKSDQKNLNLE
ncbi:MAG: NADPH-dependent assimilatory sulfite reductase hemoprotein subunit [Leptonema sp. (in: bacteria)]